MFKQCIKIGKQHFTWWRIFYDKWGEKQNGCAILSGSWCRKVNHGQLVRDRRLQRSDFIKEWWIHNGQIKSPWRFFSEVHSHTKNWLPASEGDYSHPLGISWWTLGYMVIMGKLEWVKARGGVFAGWAGPGDKKKDTWQFGIMPWGEQVYLKWLPV